MKKLKLNLDEIRLESFEVGKKEELSGGTIKGQALTLEGMICHPTSIALTCCSSSQWLNCTDTTCNPTCDDPTCGVGRLCGDA